MTRAVTLVPLLVILIAEIAFSITNLNLPVALLLKVSLVIKSTVASQTPAGRPVRLTITVPLTTVPLNTLSLTVILTVPLALSETVILAVTLLG